MKKCIFIMIIIGWGIGSLISNRIAYANRYPKPGDKIVLNGEEVVVLEPYRFSDKLKYQVRLSNGTLTDVMGSEIIDLIPIK